MDILTEKEKADKENKELVEKLNAENNRLREELETSRQDNKSVEGEGKNWKSGIKRCSDELFNSKLVIATFCLREGARSMKSEKWFLRCQLTN